MNVDNKNNNNEIYGAGGGGKGGGGKARIAQEDPNNLQSNAVARIVDLIGEGEIYGLVDGLKSVYINETPLQNHDGSFNFSGVDIEDRVGLAVQDHVPGFDGIEATTDVSTEITTVDPVVRTISNLSADAVRVTVQLPALSKQNAENGDLNENEVTIAIDVRENGGNFVQVKQDTFSGKTTSPYQRAYRIDLGGTGPWDVRVRRITDDSDSSLINDKTYFASFTTIIDSKLTYPDTAYIAFKVDAKQFGNTIPNRAYHVRGLVVNIPDNYNPFTRQYTGLWSGNFKREWTNNPAWIFYDLATNDRYGAGLDNVDKWSLYQIGRYCDEFVDNGYGGTEPRFTINTVLNTSDDVYNVLNSLSSAFMGMTYYGAGTITAVQDAPQNSSRVFTAANVINGEFKRSDSDVRTRHTRCAVSWNDPSNNFKLTTELVEDSASLQKYGIQTKEITAFGCTSRGQARRLGLWTLYTEQLETETVEFSVGVADAGMRPGDIISINDSSHVGFRLGGRLKSNNTVSTVYLDKAPENFPGANKTISLQMPDGSVIHKTISNIVDNVVTLSTSLNEAPLDNAVFALSSSDVALQEFRVLAVTDNNDNTFTISCIEHNKNKYARVEEGLIIPDSPTTLLPSGRLSPPSNINVRTYKYLDGGTEHQGALVGWTPSDDPRTKSYIAEILRPNAATFETIANTSKTSTDVQRITNGEYTFRVAAVDSIGNRSAWDSRTLTLDSLLLPVKPDSVQVEKGNFNITLIPISATHPGQLYEFYRSDVALQTEFILSNAVNLGRTTTLADNNLERDTTYFYYIRGWNAYGVSDFYPLQVKTDNNISEYIDMLTGQIRESHLYQTLNAEIEKISGPESLVGSVNYRVAEEAHERAQAILDASNNLTAAISNEATIRETEDTALAEQQVVIVSQIDDASASIVNLEQTVVDNNTATSSRIDALQSTVDDNQAFVVTTTDTIVSDVDALSSRVDTLSATVNDDMAALIQTEEDARVAADSALANQITSVQSQFYDSLASVNTSMEAKIQIVDNKVTANTNAITTAQSEWDNALTTAQNQLNTKITNVDGKVTANASAITNVQADIGDGLNAVRVEAIANAGGIVTNGNFNSGTFEGWRNVWSGISIGQRDKNSGTNAIKTAPSKYFIAFANNGWDNHRYLLGDIFPAQGGESYSFKYDYAGGGNNINIVVQMYIGWVTEDGGTVYKRAHQTRVTGTGWINSGVIQETAPPGTVGAFMYPRRTANTTNGNGSLFLTNIIASRTDIVAGSQWTAQVQSNGLVGGFGIYNDGNTVDAGFSVDKFFIGRDLNNKVAPFIVNNNQVVIDDAIINKLLFTKLRSHDGSLVFAGGKLNANYINVDSLVVKAGQSNNYIPGQQGWRLGLNGGEINFPISFGRISGAGALASKNALAYEDLAGATAPIVLERANYSNARVTNWQRPNTTRIDGNKIFTGDAYVDTLQIRGNAVVIPVATVTASATGTPTGGNWKNVSSIVLPTIDSNGKFYINFGFLYRHEFAFTATSAGLISVQVRLLTSSTVLFAPTYFDIGRTESQRVASERNICGSFSASIQLPSSYSGKAIFLQIKRITGDQFGGHSVNSRFINVLGVQR
ncbi:host specificity protein J [Vreelandella titanicae]|uniref:Uncharacterized protein n=1 Tax=Vreelandella titanicae TaxID=664683 RepID=A0AAP9NM12_9GAMM|nr:phage tail protein [Halomonas titanicae]QKS24587.1 hypothetical protein FX987_02369 [Halomonas titanicae]